MNSNKLIKSSVRGIALAALLAGCSSSNNPGGTTGSGGSTSSGTGGSSSTGTGGSSSTGTGGLSATGGSFSTGAGGSSSTGGSTGTGGVTDTGGSAAAGSGGSAGGAGGHAGAGVSGGGGHPFGGGSDTAGRSGSAGSSGSMTLTSPDQAEGAHFSSMFTCAAMNGTFGAGVNPELDWANVPAGTMSFAITFIDTTQGANNAMGQHWAIWNIPATLRQFPKGTTTLTGDLATAMQTNKYLAPCPSGNDMYEYTLYALSEASLSISGASGSGTANSAGVAKVLAALKNVTPLATATLHGTSSAMGK